MKKADTSSVSLKADTFPSRGRHEAVCDGCKCLEIEEPATSYGCYLACCTDVDKPMHGLRRVVDASTWPPFNVRTPVWCRRRNDTSSVGCADTFPSRGRPRGEGGAALGKTTR